MNTAEMKAQIRKESGIRFTREILTIEQWINWLKSHNDNNVKNIGHGMAFGMKTGRLPNWTKINKWDRVFTANHKPMTNGQMADVIAVAIVNQKNLSTAGGVKALQSAMGVVTV